MNIDPGQLHAMTLVEAMADRDRLICLINKAIGVIEGLTADSALVRIPSGGTTLEAIERAALCDALQRCHGRQRTAAAMLGITPRVMTYKLHTVHKDYFVRGTIKKADG